jgi:transcriptional regulator with XRE-family HTH domain
MHPLKRLAENLRFIRGKAQATQESFSEAVGFEFRFYQRLEDFERKSVQFSTIKRLADKLGLEVWELLSPEIESRKPKIPVLAASRRKAKHGRDSSR